MLSSSASSSSSKKKRTDPTVAASQRITTSLWTLIFSFIPEWLGDFNNINSVNRMFRDVSCKPIFFRKLTFKPWYRANIGNMAKKGLFHLTTIIDFSKKTDMHVIQHEWFTANNFPKLEVVRGLCSPCPDFTTKPNPKTMEWILACLSIPTLQTLELPRVHNFCDTSPDGEQFKEIERQLDLRKNPKCITLTGFRRVPCVIDHRNPEPSVPPPPPPSSQPISVPAKPMPCLLRHMPNACANCLQPMKPSSELLLFASDCKETFASLKQIECEINCCFCLGLFCTACTTKMPTTCASKKCRRWSISCVPCAMDLTNKKRFDIAMARRLSCVCCEEERENEQDSSIQLFCEGCLDRCTKCSNIVCSHHAIGRVCVYCY
jgi:hypothetical protein